MADEATPEDYTKKLIELQGRDLPSDELERWKHILGIDRSLLDMIADFIPSIGFLVEKVDKVIKDIAHAITGVVGGGLSAIGDWVEDFVKKVNRTVNQIGEVFRGLVVTPLNEIVSGVRDWFYGLWQPGKGGAAEAQQSQLTDQQGRIVLTEEQAEAAMQEAQEAAAVAAAAEETGKILDKNIAALVPDIGTRAKHEDVPKDTPGWQSLNPLEDVSFPRSDLERVPWRIQGFTSTEGGGSHRHFIDEATTSFVWADPIYTPPAGRYEFVFIKSTRKRIYNTITLALGPRPANPASFYLWLFRMDTTNGVPNGALTIVDGSWGGGLSTPALPAISSDVTWEFDDVQAEPGEWFAVCIMQSGGTVRPLFRKTTSVIAARAGVNPSRLSMTGNAISANIPAGTLDTASLDIPWAALGQKSALSPARYVDTFDRPNSNTIGPNWGVTGIGITLWDNAVESRRVDYGKFDSRENYTTAVWALPTNTKSQSVGTRTKTWPNYDIINEIRNKPYNSMIWLRGNADLTVGVAAMIYQNKIEIRGFNAAYPRNTSNPAFIGGKMMAEVLHANTENADWYLHAAGDGYTLYKNGESVSHAVLTAPDPAREFATGPNDKYGGMSLYAFSRGDLVPGWHGTYLSIPLDEWRLRDL
ncbi:hypothetical protein [Rhodococcus qingshengii]|uniref:hypothetical protein n=1 Tax=Rhodococcus qingshengii TaxID=334542 RepID=UPI001C8B9D2F|nr:hypothetical protein [Rhodococcus qingshengii]MBX9150109.1 hypothetical protein [Rhodococcus qingshengii]